MLDTKQNEVSAEDQEVMNEMQMLLGEFEIVNSEGGETQQKSSFELLKQCAGVLEKNIERLAQRAEVCFQPDISFFSPFPPPFLPIFFVRNGQNLN